MMTLIRTKFPFSRQKNEASRDGGVCPRGRWISGFVESRATSKEREREGGGKTITVVRSGGGQLSTRLQPTYDETRRRGCNRAFYHGRWSAAGQTQRDGRECEMPCGTAVCAGPV